MKVGQKVIMDTAPIQGLSARIKFVSKSTGGITVTLLEGRGTYQIGDAVQVKQWEVKEIQQD